MSLRRRRRLSISAIALTGTILGAVGGYWLGHVSLMRSANTALTSYVTDLIGHADEYSAELGAIKNSFNPSGFPFCSPQEIALMRSLSFRSLQVKDIGRIQNEMLICSATLGKLDTPWPMPRITMVVPGGTRVYTNVSLTIAGDNRGSILAADGVDVVLSPNAFDHWAHSGIRYMVVMADFSTRKMTKIAGATLPVSVDLALSQEKAMIDGKIYRSRCSMADSLCIIGEESTEDALRGTQPELLEYCGLGALAGLFLGLAVGQFYLQRTGLAQQLRRAIRRDRLRLVYQPILELPSGKCAGAEALVRWSDDEGNPIAPDFFIRIAEDRGFIKEITAFVIRRAAIDVGDILRKNRELTLSINISAADLEGDDLLYLLDSHIRDADILPNQVALELTERSTADLTMLRNAVLRMHKAGYQVHIDDFGTGFSSLAYLHELAVDAIKVDRTFTRAIGTDAVTANILPQILSLAQSLQLDVIVEGVETEAQADYLIATGVHMQVQGWHFGKPVIATDLPKYREQMAEAAAGGIPIHDWGSHSTASR